MITNVIKYNAIVNWFQYILSVHEFKVLPYRVGLLING